MSTLPAESPPEKTCGDLSQSELTKRFRNQWPMATTRTTTMAHSKSTRSIANGSTTTAATKCDNRKGLKKPLLQVGDLVYAAWWPEGTDRESQPSWYAGKITSFAEVDCSDGVDDAITYGPLRFYDVQFDDGDFLDDILDVFVFAKSDYLLSMRQTCWMGVKNKVDKNSVDDWAKIVGWYVALIEGQEHSFSFLTDALRAYDASIVRQNGLTTIKSQLNLPEEWAFFDLQEKRAPINIRTIKCARTSNGSKNKGHFELVSDQLPSFESGLLKRSNEALSGSSKGALISPQPVSLGIKPQPKPRNTKYRIHNIDTTKIDYEGVSFFIPRGNYKASIRHNGKGHFLCYFRLAADAAFSHDEAAILFKDSNWTFNFATRDDYEHARALELKSTDYSSEEVGSVAEVAWKINKAVSRVFAVASTAVSDDSFIETDHIASDRNAEESDLAMENSASLVAYCQDKELLPPQYSFSTNEGEAYTTDNILIGTNVGKPTERNAPIKNEPGIAPQCINNLTHTYNLQHKAERIWSRNESHERRRPPSTTTLLNPKSPDVQSASRSDSINDNKKRSDHGESKDADASQQVTTDSPLLSPLSSPKTQVNKKKRQCHSNVTSHGLNNKLNQVKDTLQPTITNYVSASSDNHKARKRKKMSDYQGVSRNTRLCKYTSRCFNVYIGVYTLSTDAAMAYDEAARRLKGSNCRLNFATIFEYEHSRARELERTGLSVDVVGTSSEAISKILEKVSNICKGINKEYLDQGTGPSAQTSKATGVLIDENFNANPNTLHAADSSPIQSRERKSDNDPSESSAKDTCMNKYPTSNTVIKPCKVLSEEEKNNHSKLIYHSNSATISSNERKRQHQLQYVRNDDDGDTSLAFHASATKQTNTPSKSIFSDIQDSACNAFDETLTQQSKCEDRMMKLTDYQAEGLKYPIGCRVWYNVEQLHCKLHADSNTQEKGRPNRNNETKNKIKRDLRKMEEMLIEKWNLKEEVITADDGNHFSKIDVVVGDASSASDQSFHSGEVISVYMDCISKEMIYRVMLVENNRKSNHNNVLVPESKLFYAANCPVYISGATVSPKEQAGEILLYRTKQASYTVLIIHGDNQFRVEKDVPLHCVRYRRVTKKHPREIPEITTKRTSNNHEEHISRLIVPCKSCDQVIESKATIQNH